MNKKGFTLIELLATIVILGLLAIIVVPNVAKIINENRDKVYKKQLENIIESAKTWGSDNIGKLPTVNNESIKVTLGELQQGGYAKNDLKNPKTEKLFDENNTYVIIKNIIGTLDYQVFVEQEWLYEFKDRKNK